MKSRKEIPSIAIIAICLVIVVLSSKLLVLAQNYFEGGSTALAAESLPALPDNIIQNQVRYLITDGYLEDNQVAVR
ncbi:MAG: hypothetical protein NTZ18_02170 [Candidatus Komeilibacteria bacterium]|nr:hypothetical protein [Candidatus Komeilibacteria bacterium]